MRAFRQEQADELEHIANELTLIAIAIRENVVTVEIVEQWCLAISSARLCHRLALGAVRRDPPSRLQTAEIDLQP